MAKNYNTYAAKLTDPRWQKKRLLVMQRDDFKCLVCCSGDKTLHVHHKSYVRGNEPWDYPLDNFMTLCFECHEAEEYEKQNFYEYISDLLKRGHTYGSLYQFLLDHMAELHVSADNLNHTLSRSNG